ncbi:hypothetical protein KI387_001868, partial [Taxus chinensis]
KASHSWPVQDIGSPEMYQQEKRYEGLLRATQVDTGKSLVMSPICDTKPFEVNLLHQSEDEKHRVPKHEIAFDVSCSGHPSTGEGKTVSIEQQLMQERLHLEEEVSSVRDENFILKTDLKATTQKIHVLEHEFVLRAEQSANKGLAEENKKLITEVEQLKETLCDMEHEKSKITFALEELRTRFQFETERKTFLSNQLEIAEQRLHEERGECYGHIGAADIEVENITKERLQSPDELWASQSTLTECRNQFELEIVTLQQKLLALESEKAVALSQLRVHQMVNEAESASSEVTGQTENSDYNELSLVNEIEKFVKETKVREEEGLNKLESLKCQLQLFIDEKDALLLKLHEEANVRMEFQNNCWAVVHNIAEMRELIDRKHNESDCSENIEEQYELDASYVLLEKEISKDYVFTRQQVQQLAAQTCQLKNQLQQIIEDKFTVMAELDGLNRSVEQLIYEKKELVRDLYATKNELDQVQYKAGLKEKLKDEKDHLVEDNRKLSLELLLCNKLVEELMQDKSRLTYKMEQKEQCLFNFYELLTWAQKVLIAIQQPKGETNLKEVSQVPVNLQSTNTSQDLTRDNHQLIDVDIVHEWETKFGKENGSFLQEVKQFSQQVREVASEYAHMKKAHGSLQQQLQVLEAIRVQSTGEISRLEEKLQDERSDLMKDLHSVNHELEQLQQENAVLRQEYELVLQQVQDLETHGEKSNAEVHILKESLQQQLQALEAIRLQSAVEISNLEEKLQDHHSNLMQDLHSVNHELEQLQQENAILQQDHELVLQQVQDLETHRAKSDAEAHVVKDQLHASAESGVTLQYKSLEVEKEKVQLVTDLDSCMIHLKELDVLSKVEKTVLDNEDRGLDQQVTKQDSDLADKVSVLKAHLYATASTSEKLQKAVQEMIHDPTDLSKGSRRAPAGISKLIRAFEAKSQHDDVILEEEPSTETEDTSQQSSEKADQVNNCNPKQDTSFVLHHLREVEDDIVHLRTTLSQVEKDTDIIQQQLMEEEEHKGYLKAALRQLEIDVNVLKQKRLEQDEILTTLTEMNTELMAQALKDTSQIENLNAQRHDLEKHANKEAAALLNQLERMQKSFAEKTTLLETERSAFVIAMLHAAQSLEESVQVVPFHLTCDESRPLSVDFRLTTVVNGTIDKINELRNREAKLEFNCQESMQIQRSFEDLTQKFEIIEQERESAVRGLHKIHKRLGKLIEPQERMNVENKEMPGHLQQNETNEAEGDAQDAHFALPLDVMSIELDKLVGQLREKLGESLQFETTISELESSLLIKDQHIQDLETRCIELSKKCIDNENCVKCAAIEEEHANMVSQVAYLAAEKDALSCELVTVQRALTEQEEALATISEVHNQLNWHLDSISEKLVSAVDEIIQDEILVTDPNMQRISHLESHLLLLIEKYKTSLEQNNLFQRCLVDLVPQSESDLRDKMKMPLDIVMREAFSCKEMELSRLQDKIDEISSARTQQEEAINNLKEFLHKTEEGLKSVSMDRTKGLLDLEQTEQKLSSVREKLSMAVSKGKGLVQQRDALKQSLAGKTDELERCWQELQVKTVALQEAETKLKSYGEAGERVEALESELAYIRNSATALRESFLHKDSVLQKIEETMEELNLPEEFHCKEITEKIEWLARSCSFENPLLSRSLGQEMSERDDRDDTGFQLLNPQLGGFNSSQNEVIEDLRRRHEELQHKYLSLAEQSDMLEQSLLERNQLIQRWEEVLDNIQMPLPVRSMEPEDRIEWLGRALVQARLDVVNAQHQIGNVQNAADSLFIELDESKRNVFILETDLSTVNHEKELLLKTFEELRCKHEHQMEQAGKDSSEKEILYNSLADLQATVVEQESNLKTTKAVAEGLLNRLIAMIRETLQEDDLDDLHCSSSSEYLEGCMRNLIHQFKYLSEVVQMHKETNQEEPSHMVVEQESNLKTTKADTEGMLNRLIVMIREALQEDDFNDLPCSSSVEYLEGCLRNLLHKFKSLSEVVLMHKETNQVEPSHMVVLASNAAELSSLQVALDVKEHKLLEMGSMLEEAASTVASYKSEGDKLLEQCRLFSGEAEALKNQRDALQIQLEQTEQKLSSTKDKLSIAVKKGKGVVQQRDILKQTVDEKLAELEQLKKDLQVRESMTNECKFQIKDLSSRLDNYKMLESEAISSRNHSAELEKALHESKILLQGIMTALDAINCARETQFRDPVKEIEWLIKSSQELKVKEVSAEQEVKKLKKAAELLAAELDEVNERMESLEDELEKAQSEVFMLKTEKNAAEAGKDDATLSLEHALAARAEEANEASGRFHNQNLALLNLRTDIEHLRKEHGFLLPLLANDFFKKLELLRNLEDTLQGILNELAKLKGSEVPGLLTNPHEEGNYLPSEYSAGLYPIEHVCHLREHLVTNEKQMTDDLFSSLVHELEGCIECVEILKNRFEGQSATFNQKATGMLQMTQVAVQEVASLAESFETSMLNVTNLKDLTKEKDSEIVTLRRNIGILFDAFNNAMVEFQNVKAEIKDVDRPNSEGWLTVPNNSRPALGFSKTTETINQVGFTLTDSTEITEKLMLAAKDFVNIQTEKFKCQLSELSTKISQLQQEAEARVAEKSSACGELQIKLMNTEFVANNLARERDMYKERICQLEKRVETLQNDYCSLELGVQEFQARETFTERMQDEVRSLHDTVSTKSQEVEVLMQALDEADLHMESLASKVKELEIIIQKKQASLENLESSRGKAVAKLSATVNRLEDLRKLSEGLITEVESLQLQLETRDTEVSRLRQEVRRCTDDVLSSQEIMKSKVSQLQELEAWLERIVSKCGVYDGLHEDRESSKTHALMIALENRIVATMSELDSFCRDSKDKDALLQDAHRRMHGLSSKVDLLESNICDKKIQVEKLQRGRSVALGPIAGPEASEIEEMVQISKRSVPLPTVVPHVRSARKSSNDQIALNIDVESGQSTSDLEDDDKGHVFKSLISSRLIPKVTRPIADRIDGI